MVFNFIFYIDWDKAPNWIQAIGAVIAAFGLLVTLILQRNTLKEQQKITELDQKRFLDSYLPILDLSNIKYSKRLQIRDVSFDIIVRQNHLRNLTIAHNFNAPYKVIVPYYISDVILPQGYLFQFSIHAELSPVFVEVEEYTGNTFIFNFEDAFGNKYTQYLIYKGAKNLFLQPAFRVQ